MKAQTWILALAATYAGVGEATLCWTNGLNLLMGGQPWGPGCRPPPVAPRPPPSCPACPVVPASTVTSLVTSTVTATSISTLTTTTTTTTTTTSFGINPATAAAASGVCMGLNPPRATPLFDAGGNPACCVPIVVGGQRVC